MAKHAELVAYIGKVLSSMRSWLLKQTMHRIALVIFLPAGHDKEGSGSRPVVIERFVFDIALFAEVTMSVESLEQAREKMASLFLKINMLDAVLSSNSPNCTWTVLLYTHEHQTVTQPSTDPRERRLQQEARERTWREWVPEEPARADMELVESVIHPLRDIETPAFAFSLRVEESQTHKDELGSTQASVTQ
jgi:hypothetical protein